VLLKFALSKWLSMGYLLFCKKCEHGIVERVQRGFFLKNVLFFLPVKKYMCTGCFRQWLVLTNSGVKAFTMNKEMRSQIQL